jgi:hypothetical protein
VRDRVAGTQKGAIVARSTARSLRANGHQLAGLAMDTWNGLAATVEDAASRARIASHDARESVRGAGASARAARTKARKKARKQVKDARKQAKGVRKETARRTGAAREALAGRRPGHRWPALIAFAGVGAALGALGARLAKRPADDADLDRIDADRLESDLSAAAAAVGTAPVPHTETTPRVVRPTAAASARSTMPVPGTVPVPTSVPTPAARPPADRADTDDTADAPVKAAPMNGAASVAKTSGDESTVRSQRSKPAGSDAVNGSPR